MLPASGCLQSQGSTVAAPDPPPPATTTAAAAALNQGQGLTLEGVGDCLHAKHFPMAWRCSRLTNLQSLCYIPKSNNISNNTLHVRMLKQKFIKCPHKHVLTHAHTHAHTHTQTHTHTHMHTHTHTHEATVSNGLPVSFTMH